MCVLTTVNCGREPFWQRGRQGPERRVSQLPKAADPGSRGSVGGVSLGLCGTNKDRDIESERVRDREWMRDRIYMSEGMWG